MKEEQIHFGVKEDNEQKMQNYKELKDVVNKWKNWISVSEHNFEQKISFLEKDKIVLEQNISEMIQKSNRLNEVLENQHKIFNEFINADSNQ